MKRTTGFTLIELMVATAVLAIMLLMLAAVMDGSAKSAKFSSSHTDAQSAARRIMLQISRDLQNSGGDDSGDYVFTHPYTAGGTAAQVEFSMRETIKPGGATWSNRVRYELADSAHSEANLDGTDDDRDGVIDERALVRREAGVDGVLDTGDDIVLVLDHSVTAFSVVRTGGEDKITITIEVARGHERNRAESDEDWVTVRQTRSVYLLNRPGS